MTSSSLVLRDPDGLVVLVKAHRQGTWRLPGGIAQEGESPRQAAERSASEELGIRCVCERLLCVDFHWTTGLHFVFDGGTLDAGTLESVVVDGEEVKQWRLVAAADAHGWAEPGPPAELTRSAMEALRIGNTLYLEDGLSKRLSETE